MIRVLIADDHAIVRRGLRAILEAEHDVEVAGECGDGAQAVSLATEMRPDVVLMDLKMPVLDGVAATKKLAGSGSHIVVLTTFDTDSDILRAIEAGATSYLLKDATGAELITAIRAAARGNAVLAPPVATKLVDAVRRPVLTTREIEVVGLVAQGLSNGDIAGALHLSEATVKSHLLHVFTKLDVADRTAAVTVARDRGWLR